MGLSYPDNHLSYRLNFLMPMRALYSIYPLFQAWRIASAPALSLGRPDDALEWPVEGRWIIIVWNQLHQHYAHDRDLAERFSG